MLKILSPDELARLVSFIDSDTLVSLLWSEASTFSSAIPLLSTRFYFFNRSRVQFDFKRSTLSIGISAENVPVAKSHLEGCKGLQFKRIDGSLDKGVNLELLQNLTELFSFLFSP